jgi:uncharacterized protein YcfL
MRTNFALLILSLAFLAGCKSEFDIPETDVPQQVVAAFQQKYPSVTATGWEVEKSDGRLVYEAEFMMDKKKKEAEFRPDGTFVKEE